MTDRLSELINAQLDGAIGKEEACELNSLLKTDPQAALAFAEASMMHQALADGFENGSLPCRLEQERPTSATPHVNFSPRVMRFLPWGIAIAASIIAIVGPWNGAPSTQESSVAMTESHTQSPLWGELHDSGYAVLTRVVEPRWADDQGPAQSDLLTAGSYHLENGLAQIEFLSGVSIVLDGEAEFEIISAEEMHLTRGKIRAHVPAPAIGFQIHTPRGTVLDLGTEFALDLAEDRAELHVLDGEVEWHPEGQDETLLRSGEALRVDGDHTEAIPSQPERFTGPDQLARRFGRQQEKNFQVWQQASAALRQRGDMIAYYPMENLGPWDRDLPGTQTNLQPGAIVAAEIVPGRWPSKQALDFSPNGSRVRIEIPGEYRQLTFSTWARIDSLDRQFNALFLTDNYDEGEPHWQLLDNGRLFFSVGLGKERYHHIHESPVVWTHDRSQQWLHLVTTYDCASRTACHYLNGELVSHSQAPESKPTPFLRIGSAQIGNWGLPTQDDPDFAVRNLNGRLDEFALFSTALTPSEVHQLYLSGKP